MALTAAGFAKLSAGEKKAYLKKHPTSMHNPKNKRAKVSSTNARKKVKPTIENKTRLTKIREIRAEIAKLRERHAGLEKTSTSIRFGKTRLGFSARREMGVIKRKIALKQKQLQASLKK